MTDNELIALMDEPRYSIDRGWETRKIVKRQFQNAYYLTYESYDVPIEQFERLIRHKAIVQTGPDVYLSKTRSRKLEQGYK